MPSYLISAEAQEDIDAIADYTMTAWGWRQSGQYLAKLEDCFSLLANYPSIGRVSDSVRSGLLRFESGRHVVFYLPDSDGVLIVRILHQQVLPGGFV